jgi:3-oxoacyl-[acyl-carrier protein] reductase
MKNVLITGATGGIGSALIDEFYKKEYNLFVTGSNKEKLESIKSNYAKNLETCACDLSKDKEIDDLIRKAEEYYGSIDILINNAGITKDNLFIRINKEDWNRVIDVNLNANFSITKLAIKGMIKKKWGRIINISSDAAKIGNPGQTNYVASKSAIEGFSRSLASEVASRNVTVNCVSPGFINTSILDSVEQDKLESMAKNIPCGRIGDPKDVANAVFFLASEESSYITGQVIHVNGGLTM